MDQKGIVALLFLTTIVAAVSTVVFYHYALPTAATDQPTQVTGQSQGFVQLSVVEEQRSTGMVSLMVVE